MTPQRTTRTLLSNGQALHLRAKRGMTVVAASGAIRISGAPVWLAERVLHETTDVGEGEAHVVRHAGWIAITALGAAEVICISDDVKGWSAPARWCDSAAAGLRRCWQSIAPGIGRG